MSGQGYMMAKKKRDKKGGEPLAAPSPESIKKEKEKARVLKDSVWWQNQLAKRECYYCGHFARKDLTMDHIVPVSRGGKSTKGNVVVACQPCNSDKKYYTAAELILKNQMNSKINF